MTKCSHRRSERREVSVISIFSLFSPFSLFSQCRNIATPSGWPPFHPSNILLPYMVTFSREEYGREGAPSGATPRDGCCVQQSNSSQNTQKEAETIYPPPKNTTHLLFRYSFHSPLSPPSQRKKYQGRGTVVPDTSG